MDDSEEDADSTDLPDLDAIIKSSLPAPSPPKKRRRLDPSPALSRPFRSPFKTPLKTSSQSSQNTNIPIATPIHPPSAASKHTPNLTPTTTTTNPSIHRSSPKTNFPTGPSSRATSSHNPLSTLLKQHTTLLNELSSLRRTLDTTTQALEIEASSADAELEALIKKWKGVSQEAAEAVFEIMKGRMEDVGGARGWRKLQEGVMGRTRWGWEGEEGEGKGADKSGEGCESGGGDLEGTEDGGNIGEDDGEGEGVEEDETFSMEMMLKSLDIPLSKIGYDGFEERWVD